MRENPGPTAAAGGGTSASVPVLRWSVWLSAGVLAGLLVGFAVGLGRPRPRLTGPVTTGS